jgi:hypothetical protein
VSTDLSQALTNRPRLRAKFVGSYLRDPARAGTKHGAGKQSRPRRPASGVRALASCSCVEPRHSVNRRALGAPRCAFPLVDFDCNRDRQSAMKVVEKTRSLLFRAHGSCRTSTTPRRPVFHHLGTTDGPELAREHRRKLTPPLSVADTSARQQHAVAPRERCFGRRAEGAVPRSSMIHGGCPAKAPAGCPVSPDDTHHPRQPIGE